MCVEYEMHHYLAASDAADLPVAEATVGRRKVIKHAEMIVVKTPRYAQAFCELDIAVYTPLCSSPLLETRNTRAESV